MPARRRRRSAQCVHISHPQSSTLEILVRSQTNKKTDLPCQLRQEAPAVPHPWPEAPGAAASKLRSCQWPRRNTRQDKPIGPNKWRKSTSEALRKMLPCLVHFGTTQLASSFGTSCFGFLRRERVAWRAMQEEQAEKRKTVARDEAPSTSVLSWYHGRPSQAAKKEQAARKIQAFRSASAWLVVQPDSPLYISYSHKPTSFVKKSENHKTDYQWR